ncbi:MAG: flagellar motor protein MotB [Planctomycetota bacterium]
MGRKSTHTSSAPAGAPEWIVTFTDMISLLVTFFVLLMTFSSVDEHDYLRVEAWLTGNVGILPNRGMHAVEAPEDDVIAATDIQRGGMQPHDRPTEDLHTQLAEIGQRKRAGDLELRFTDVQDGLVIEFGPAESFAAGSAVPPPSLVQSLGEIGRTLEAYPHLVVVEGFPDPDPAPSGRYPTPETLAFARASRAADAMLQASRLPIERVQIVGQGLPGAEGDESAAGGAWLARCVRIRVLALSKVRASFLESGGR